MQILQKECPASANANAYFTSILWVLWYAPQTTHSKNSSVEDFCIKRYLIGTRYYDGDLGLWTSVDAMRQFWSPMRMWGMGGIRLRQWIQMGN